MTKKKSNTPRHKRLTREGRLQAAKYWLVKYNGNNKVRGYSKHFAVDLLCAAQELKMLGILVEEKYIKELEIDKKRRVLDSQRKKEMKKLEEYNGYEEIDFIVGYTDGGIPYGLNRNETELLEDEELNGPW